MYSIEYVCKGYHCYGSSYDSMYPTRSRYEILIIKYSIIDFMFKGLRCYDHTPCAGNACPDISSNNTGIIKTCKSDETKCWVSI